MRIAIVSTYGVQCGIATYTDYLGKALRDQGHDILVFAEAMHDNKSLDENTNALPCNRCWSRYGNFHRLELAINRWKPDVVHIQYESALFTKLIDLLLLVNKLRKNFPVVITFHNIINDKVFSQIFGRTSCSIVHYSGMAETVSAYGVPKGTVITVIPHGSREVKLIDSTEAKKALGIPPEKKVISVFGFVGKYKGHYTMLILFSKLLELEPNAYLLFAGGVHPITPELAQNHIDSIQATMDANKDKMKMTGYIPEKDLDTYIAASDVIVFPHIVHAACSISGATHSVLGGGKPIVTTMFPLYDDLTTGVNCLRFPINTNVYTLPLLFSELLNSSDITKKIGEGAKKLAEETSWKNVAAMTAQVYERVVKK